MALAFGAACRFWDLTGKSLFIDEGWVFHISGMAARDIPSAVANTDFHPPLFYFVTHYLESLLRWPPWDYRYLTAAFSLLGIAATWAIARRFFGDFAAAIAGVAIALEPVLIEWDRLYRMYAVLVAFTAISWWLLVRAVDSRGPRRWMWWVAYGLSAVTLPYVQYIGGVVVASQAVYALVKPRERWPALIGCAAAALAFIPWIWAVRIQFPHGGLVTPLALTAEAWPHLVRSTLISGVPVDWLSQPAFDLWFSFVSLVLLGAGVYVARNSVVPYWVAPIAVQLMASVALHKNLLIPRYLFAYVPAFCIAFGALCGALWVTRFRVAALALSAVYFGLAIIGVSNNLFVPFYQFPDWYEVNEVLLVNERPSDLIVLDQGAEYWVVHDFSGFRNHQIDAPGIPSDVPRTIRWLAGYPSRRVWYVENQPAFTDPKRQIKASLDASRTVLRAWRQNRLFREDTVVIILYGTRASGVVTKRAVKTTSP